MFPALWYYFSGYVMIRVSGFSMERFLNMASYRNVYFWDVDSSGTGLCMKTSLSGLEEARYCAQKTGCDLEILAWGGLPARYRRFRKREALWLGALFFAAGLYVLSSFVWTLDVEGNERVAEETILSACEEMGLFPGAWKRNVDADEVTKGLLTEFTDLSWVSVSIHGTDATVKVAETIVAPEIVEKETPCDMIAAKDGVILEMTVERGTPLVKTGDVVKKGQVLISSEVVGNGDAEAAYVTEVAAAGSVKAETWMEWSEEMPLSYQEKVYTGEEKTNHVLLLKDLAVDLVHPSEAEGYEKEILSSGYFSLGDFQLPLGWQKERIRYYTEEEKSRTEEEAKQELEADLRKKAEEYIRGKGIIEEWDIKYESYANCVRAVATAKMSEDIAEKKEKGA